MTCGSIGGVGKAAFERRARATFCIRKLPTGIVVQEIRSKVGEFKLSHPGVSTASDAANVAAPQHQKVFAFGVKAAHSEAEEAKSPLGLSERLPEAARPPGFLS